MFIVNIRNIFAVADRELAPIQRSYHTRKAAKRAMVKARHEWWSNVANWQGQEKAWITEIPGRFQFNDGDDASLVLARAEAH